MTGASLRPAQARVLAYTGGRLAISAVPGAGKTFVLTQLALRLVADLAMPPSQILVLTYMRSAAGQFRRRLDAALAERGLSAAGLVATTLHGFCLSLLARQASRAGEPEGLRVLSEAERARILHEGLDHYLADAQRRARYDTLNPPGDTRWSDPKRQSVEAALAVVAAAKHHRLDGAAVAAALAPLDADELPYLLGYYEDAVAAARMLDFDDLIRRAIGLLEGDPALLAEVRRRHRYVLEDEAQDSTPAQNHLLELLAGPDGNLVRVGDPNQAILGTFTANDPRYFRAFCARSAHVAMNESSRSGTPILAFANALVAIARTHAMPAIAEAFEPVAIRPASAGPANPEPAACGVRALAYATFEQERLAVVQQVRAHTASRGDHSVAVLVTTNAQAAMYRDWLSHAGANVHAPDEGAATSACMLAFLEAALAVLALPSAPLGPLLAEAAITWWRLVGHAPSPGGEVARHVREHPRPEAYLVPVAGLAPARPAHLNEADYASAVGLLRRLGELLGARYLPAGVLAAEVAAIAPLGPAQDAGFHAVRLLARELPEGDAEAAREWLSRLRRGAGRRSPFAPRESQAIARPGVVQVLTLHKAKGAEFDAVWLPGLGPARGRRSGATFPFPWRPEEVNLFGHKALLARAALEGRDARDAEALLATARQEAIAERLRLLYVGITRARRYLTLTCETRGGRVPPPEHLQALFSLCSPR